MEKRSMNTIVNMQFIIIREIELLIIVIIPINLNFEETEQLYVLCYENVFECVNWRECLAVFVDFA